MMVAVLIGLQHNFDSGDISIKSAKNKEKLIYNGYNTTDLKK